VSYQLGIDLGTTYSAAAVFRDGAATIFSLGSRGAAIPSVVLLRADGAILTGDAAERRAMSEPERVVREFKRRLGDTTPIIVGGSPHTAEELAAHLLASIYEAVRAREGGDPSKIVITHPANWGTYKRELLERAVAMAKLDTSLVSYLTEPEAAALSYAAQERIETGEIVAVYDLGGGTFDAAILERTPDGFSVLGKPEGVERLGGIDFDAAIFSHVADSLGPALTELNHDDPAALAAVARLRLDCVEAKEALSADTDATVPVLLPNLQTELRITRREFEALIRPSLLDSIEAMQRAVRSAGLDMADVTRVLLVGGSSRIPLISLLVTSELGRPVAVDAHPKHAIALGAAFAASGILDSSSDAAVPTSDSPAMPRGLDPNMTIVAPAHLYNPGIGSGKALPIEKPIRRPAAEPVEQPVERRPAAASDPPPAPMPDNPNVSRPSALPVEQPSRRPPQGLPIENPSSGRTGGGAGAAKALPIEQPNRPPPIQRGQPQALPVEPRPAAKAEPVAGRRPPPQAPGTPSADEYRPTSLYQESTPNRTSVYPGGNPPTYGNDSRGPGRPPQPAPKKRSPAVWLLGAIVVVAVILVGVLLALAFG
jgi:actin-like ATPase involved in cell morphogenesis